MPEENKFYINQIFEDSYPPEAAMWCNESHKAYINEISPTTEGVRRFQIVALPEPTEEEIKAQELANAKNQRAQEVSELTVTVDDMVFDADESAQQRITRVITIAESAELASIDWVLADNTIANVTIDQLKQVLAKAVLAQAELWTIPYQKDEEDSTLGLAEVGI